MFCFHHIISFVLFFELFLWRKSNIHCYPVSDVSENRSSDILIDLLNIAQNVLHNAKKYAKSETRSNTSKVSTLPMDCAEIYQINASATSGIHNIWPRNRIIKAPVTVYCDMNEDGGAWTILQRRGDFDSPKDYFYRDWLSYKNGFGDAMKDFWLGNDNIYALTNERENILKFTLSDWEGKTTYATYDEFWIDDEAHNYTAHVSGYRGTAGDSFSFTNGYAFATKDKGNTSSCAVTFKGAWWYKACHLSNLNGLYLKGVHESYADGVEWSSFKGDRYSLKGTVIKIRPKDFRKMVESDMTPQ